MKIHLSLLPLALFLPLAACSKSEAGAPKGGNPADAAAAAAKQASSQTGDLSKLTPDALAAKAKSSVDELHKELLNVKDVEGAKALAAKYQPTLDQLVSMKDKLATHLDKANIQKIIDDVTAKLSSTKEVMAAIQPLVDKLKALIA